MAFLGRIDQQVKIRGFRVEPGEIETALREHPAVREAAVIALPDPSGNLSLVAYVVADTAAPELRGFLARRLPAHMVPSAFVSLESLPLTPNGKLDRRSLPEPVPETRGEEETLALPRTPYEELLAGLWAQLLGLPRVGVHDNFFALGGHSLLGARLVTRVRDVLGVELPLRTLFEAPTIAGLAGQIDSLRRPDASEKPPLLPTGAAEAPLSFAQERLWFLDRLLPDSALYSIPAVLRLTGELDPTALRQSFTEIVRRHGTLRTTFAESDGGPRQVVAPSGPVPLPLIDLSGLPAEPRDREAAQRILEEVRRPFDLASGPVLRLLLLRYGRQDHGLIANVHHIASDGWSMGVLVRESTALYQAFAQGLPSPLPELSVQYADFALWQRAWLSGPVLDVQLGFWRRELEGVPALLELPTDRPRPAVQSYRGDALGFALPAAATDAVHALALRVGATPFMVLLAAFQTLLRRWSGADDVLVGSPLANRSRVETEELIGMFVNTLVFPLRLRGDESFLQALERVRSTALAAHDHQDLPVELLVDALAVERSLAHTPLFQVMLVLQNAPLGELRLPGLTFAPVDWPATTAKFDLTLSLGETGEGFAGSLEYATDLFDRTTVQRFLGHLGNLLASAAEDPGRSLADLRLMDVVEERMLLAGLNQAERTYARPVTVQELFAEQALRTPRKAAAVGPQGTMTYRELDERATALAARLPQRPDLRIGLLADPDPQVLVGMLGILKAGGGFVPIDPRSPEERLAWILEDSGCEALVTQRRHLERVAGFRLRRVLCLDDLDGAADGVEVHPEPRSLAYVVYTSGSTGRPKGVQVTHENLVPMLLWGCEYLGLGKHSRVLRSLSFFFDFGIFEHLTTVLAGGTLFYPGEAAGDPAAFAQEILRHGINTLHTTPAFARELAGAGIALDSLEIVHLGGEALSRDTVARLREAAPHAAVYNGYGPTEATVNSSIFRVDASEDAGWPVLPIGRRSADNSLYILDRAGRPVPYGVRGELHVGGIGVARGYLDRPGLTAEKFIPDPFGAEPGGRLYRTGDLVRYLPSRDIEFLGRIDQQVKIRGFRVEPGEIEAALRDHKAVREAAVLARPEPSGNLRLVAYVVADAAAPELRDFLAHRLPPHMVPSAFVALGALPLTPNGKLDRKALPAPESAGATDEASFTAPRTPREELLAGLWAQLLDLPRVGVHDNFFALGGHSLLGARLVSRVRQVLGVELPLRTLFEAPTVAGLAERIDALRTIPASEAPPLLPTGATEAPLSFAQERLWFLDRLQPDSAFYSIPAVLRLSGDLDVNALQRTFTEIVRRHATLRTTFAAPDGTPLQRIAPALPVPLPVLDLSGLPALHRERETEHRILRETGQPFDLAQGPVVRLHLLRQDREGHILIANVHHIASDGWSMGIMVRETTALYAAFVQGLPSPLPELPVQYADFALWQRAWLSGPVLDVQLGFWRRELEGVPALLELPTDRPRPAVQSYRGDTLGAVLPAEATDAVHALALRVGATPFMVLLAAFQTLLHRWSGADDVLVGSPLANRSQVETEELIGMFVNTLVFPLRLRGDESFLQALERVRSTALAAHDHQDLPVELLVDELAVERSLAHTPLFQVMLVLQNAPLGELRLPGLTFAPVDWPANTAKLDLTLSLGETGEGFAGSLEYATDLFDRTTVQRFLGHLGNLLASAAEDPGRSLADLRLMDAAEERMLLEGLNQAERTYARPATVQELFAEQALRTPDKTAADGPQGAMTYRELDERSTALAARIPQRLDLRIGLLADPDPQVLIGMLGILKAGGGFVPIDPRSPEERLAWLLKDSGCEALVTQRRHLERVAGLGLRHVLCLEDLEDLDEAGAAVPTDPRSLAYVVYTSGSTGRPKGVQISHESLVPMLLWGCEYLGLGEHTRVLRSLSFFFDFGIFEHLTTVLAGGTLVFPGEAAGDPAAFAREIVRHGINTLHTTPAFARELAAAGIALDSLDIVHLGGEALSRDTVARLREAAPHAAVYNGYGPTEATVNSSIFRVGASEDAGWPVLPIGRRSADNSLYILDRAGRPVPYGVRGELHVGGIGVARGYLGRPGLTAEKLIPDPFGAEPGGRLYRTGDLVRYLPSGDIEFLGRIDQQVKVRGFRVEPGEIEAALRDHKAVREAAVVARPEPSGNLRLVAYVVADAAAPELRDFLAHRLPPHMVPSAFVALYALPLTPNGKLDRKALPAPESAGATGEASFTAPRTPREELLAGLWAQLLERPRIGIFDNFFELGGHSLLGARLISRVRQVLGVELPLRTLFEAPTVSGLAERIDGLRSLPASEAPPLLPTGATEAPLSFAQERLWFLDRLQPDSAAYSMPLVLRITGNLDVEALRRTFTEIVRRHATLRTTFTEAGGTALQVIGLARAVPLPVLDLSGLPEPDRDRESRRQVLLETGRPFDLAQGPALRLRLLRQGRLDHILIANVHHIASDGWSTGILARETTALYEAFAQGLPSPLPEPPVQYADFALWQRAWLSGPVLDAQLDFWRRELEGVPALLDLPTDRPRPAVQSYRGDTLGFLLPPEASAAVPALAQRVGATPFMVLLAAFQTLLHRWSGADDVLVGSPIANRSRVETEELIGMFVNTLVFPLRLHGDESFLAALERVRSTALAAHDHQDLPFELLVHELAVERSLAHTPLFQVMLALQNLPAGELRLPGLTFAPVEWPSTTAKFDLTLSLVETPGGFAGALEYAADLFDRTTVERFLGHLGHLLTSAAADPGQPLAEIPLMSPAEELHLLAGLNPPGRTYALPVTVHELFGQQALRTPDNIAAVGPQGALTYRELDELSRALAARLPRRADLRADLRIGLLADPDPQVLVGMLGILKAGGGFVPIDPRSPEDRLAWILADSACEVLVTQRRHLERAQGTGARHILCLDDLDTPGAEAGAPVPTEPLSLAYVIYTSGSTGRPKGVQVSHASLAPMLLWGCDHLGLGEHTRVLQSLSFFFDFGVFEELTTVLAGGTLFYPGEAAGDPAAFAREIRRQGINTLHTTPVFARELAAAGAGGLLDTLDIVHLGGEALAWDTIERIRGAAPRAAVYNGYGPTEATINSSICRVDGMEDAVWPVAPIGRPSADNALYILDRTGHPVPLGFRGELHVGGIGVARGYVNRPDLTAERFVPDPFGPQPGGRLYRTGDLVRCLPGGDIEFLGRIDQQVKIRGFRIEPGEIEAALVRHPGVREARVLVYTTPPGEKSLVGYLLLPAGEEAPAVAELRDFLRERLPEPMVPAAFVALAAWPLTPNGKLDLRALPAPEGTASADRIAPRDTLEHEVARAWEEVLGIAPIGIRDDFFALGGHSLLAVRLMSKIEERLGRSLPLSALFTAGTVEGMAARLRADVSASPASNLIPLQPRGSQPPFFWVHPAGGDVLCYAALARQMGDDQPFYGIQARGFTEDEEPPASIEEMAALYLEEVRRIEPAGPYFLGGWSLGGPVAYEMARQLRSQGETVGLLVVLDATPGGGAELEDEPEDADYLLDIAAYVGNFWGRDPEVTREHLAGLGPEEQIAHVALRLAAVDFLPPGTGETQLRRVLAVYRANVQSLRRYRPGPYPDPFLLLRAEEPLFLTEAPGEEDLGWNRITGGPIEIRTVPGNHLTLLAEPNVRTLASRLRICLEQAHVGEMEPAL
ncbi:MAG TPA: amino acid adenylation domain-containing protein [Thermoanaerobaculia bacterium]|nr:amino acid adenylation domain-containing protein [Thermoanaerobaculia bacterium]